MPPKSQRPVVNFQVEVIGLNVHKQVLSRIGPYKENARSPRIRARPGWDGGFDGGRGSTGPRSLRALSSVGGVNPEGVPHHEPGARREGASTTIKATAKVGMETAWPGVGVNR